MKSTMQQLDNSLGNGGEGGGEASWGKVLLEAWLLTCSLACLPTWETHTG